MISLNISGVKKSLLCIALFFLNLTFSLADNYPKSPRVDVINYVFRIELSDNTDQIKCEVTVDVRYLGDGIEVLRLDLIKANAPGDKGMRLSQVISEGKALNYTHENDALEIKLPAASISNQRSTYTITYSGIPATGLKIANNKYGDRTFFSDNWPDKARNWLAVVTEECSVAVLIVGNLEAGGRYA